MIMAQYMDSSERLLQAAVEHFIDDETEKFKWAIIIAALSMTVYFILFNLILIHVHVVYPINELADMIQSPQDAAKVNKFITNLKKREFS